MSSQDTVGAGTISRRGVRLRELRNIRADIAVVRHVDRFQPPNRLESCGFPRSLGRFRRKRTQRELGQDAFGTSWLRHRRFHVRSRAAQDIELHRDCRDTRCQLTAGFSEFLGRLCRGVCRLASQRSEIVLRRTANPKASGGSSRCCGRPGRVDRWRREPWSAPSRTFLRDPYRGSSPWCGCTGHLFPNPQRACPPSSGGWCGVARPHHSVHRAEDRGHSIVGRHGSALLRNVALEDAGGVFEASAPFRFRSGPSVIGEDASC